MAKNLGTLNTFTESLASDYLLARKGDTDVKVLRDALYEGMNPAGTVLLLSIGTSPSDLGYKGVWLRKADVDSRIETATPVSTSLGTFEGNNTITIPLPEHTHGYTISPAGAHSHTYSRPNAPEESPLYGLYDSTQYYGFDQTPDTATSEDGEHFHTVTVNSTGTSSTSMSLLSKAKHVALWVKQ